MPVKTIIVNGDNNWDFRSILMCHGLDLFQVDSNVFFRDGTPVNEADGGLSTLLANFPEDFSQDPYALEAEIREDLRRVFRDKAHAISLGVILSREDVAHFVRAGKNWEADPRLSDPAKVALRAVHSATRLIAEQTDQDGTVSQANTRVWFSIIIRDAGASSRDGDLADSALEQLAGPKGHVHNAFLLSNGVDLDSRTGEQVEHFVKLRVLIDLLRTDPAHQLRGQIRTSQRSGLGGGVAVIHVRLPEDSPIAPEFSAVLRKSLITEMAGLEPSRGATKESGGADAFRAFSADVRKMLPAGWSDVDSLEVTSKGLDADVKEERDRIIKRDDLKQSERAKADAEQIIRKLSGKRFRNRLFMPFRKPDFYEQLRQEYEAAFRVSRETYSNVVDQRILMGREAAAKDRPDLVRKIENVVLPSAADGEAEVEQFRNEIKAAKAATEKAITSARSQAWRLSETDDGGSAEREKAFRVTQLAENNLMGPSAIKLIVLILLMTLLPVVIYNVIGAIQGGFSFRSLTDIFNAVGAMGYVVGFSFVSAVIAGFVTAFRVMKKRKDALNDLTGRLAANFDTLRGLAASRLALSLNRVRQSDLQLVWQGVTHTETHRKRDLTKDFSTLLMQVPDEMSATNIDEVKFDSLVATARAGFKNGKSDNEKIRNFLSRRETPDPTNLRVTLRGMSDQTGSAHTFSQLTDMDVFLVEPGRD